MGPRVVVITGPSGVGKGTLIRSLRERFPQLRLSISATTRQPRPGEEHGVDYYFLSGEEFEEHVQEGDFVEYASYAGNRYGTLRSELDRILGEGNSVVLEIELQGARLIREALPEAMEIFIAPPNFESLRTRLIGRGTDVDDQIEERLATAREEIEAKGEFAYVVVNDRLDDAVEELAGIIDRSNA